MKKLIFLTIILLTISCKTASVNTTTEKPAVTTMLNNWHKAAAEAKADAYFGAMTPDSRYIGTDATENWQLDAFKAFSKPYFDKGRAWNFKAVERNIYFSEDGKLAWFDELLDTWMGICRGSGVLKRQNGEWKIVHYVLSMTVPNDNTDEIIKAKKAFDEAYLKKRNSAK